ncbi:1-aminocyclopropane-1-carboxylate deaminase [Mycena venus]|uniref:1-aminocyclopropane-1-carboxylate deaminase n=1 Tax=Mycena venus TaxID=2733690 RepID=A0A8H6XT56_9AGAR|nr:1-aminocyclopropane-1-carboxylate deaminase [Mycena venus]
MILQAKPVQEHWADWQDVVCDKLAKIQLSHLMGAELRLEPATFSSTEHNPTVVALTAKVIASGGKPYYIPAGVSDHPLGGLGFARWAFEVVDFVTCTAQVELSMSLKRKKKYNFP